MALEGIINVVFKGFFINFTLAVAIILLGMLLGRFLSNLTRKLLKGLKADDILKREIRIKFPIVSFLTSFVKYGIYFLSVYLALSQFNIATTVFGLIIGLILLGLLFVLLIGLKNFFPNLYYGFKVRKKFKVNSNLKLDVVKGKIIKIGFLETTVDDNDDEIVIPNSVLIKKSA